MSDLPYEIIEQIILRLPARSLLRFSLVCKRWKSLISDPNFVKDHTYHALLDQSSRHQRSITGLKASIEDESWRLSITSESIDYQSPNSTVSEFIFETGIRCETFGCCNGLLLVDAHVLLNPLLSKKYKVLPPCDVDLYSYAVLHGLGYAPSVDDYKVVRLYKGYFSNAYAVQVYSLKTNSWKTNSYNTDSALSGINIMSSNVLSGTHLQGSVYWPILNSEYTIAILAFDVATENFRLINTPLCDDRLTDFKTPVYIVNARGYLGVYRPDVDRNEIVIWIWNEVENREGYWSKLLAIPRKYPALTRVLSFMNSYEVLLHVSEKNSEKLVIYDTVCMTFRVIPCDRAKWSIRHVVLETLIWPIIEDGDLNGLS